MYFVRGMIADRVDLGSLGFISCEELLQDWNYRLRKPCGNNFEAAKPEEKRKCIRLSCLLVKLWSHPVQCLTQF